jgi:hypothetical protein
MTDITDAGPRLKAMNDRLEELRAAADKADVEYRAEIARLRLTDEEREAIERAAGDYLYHQDAGGRAQWIRTTLLGLLERLK